MVENVDQATAAVRRLTLKHPPYPTKLEYTESGFTVTVEVPCRDTGNPIGLRFTWGGVYKVVFPCPEFELFDAALRCLKETYAHQASEALHLDGVRTWDPHPSGYVEFGSDLPSMGQEGSFSA